MTGFLDPTLNEVLYGNGKWFSEALSYLHERSFLDVTEFLSWI